MLFLLQLASTSFSDKFPLGVKTSEKGNVSLAGKSVSTSQNEGLIEINVSSRQRTHFH